ncbi:MAG: TetR/AcrR family transcriptional regulator [Oleibacter sp.]|nr:TetR/AcrR family transcriptional regulator [Thalassolituus sp.]
MAQKDTVNCLLEAAEELFSERGFAETSLRNITTRAGVNLASVNYHFGSKKSLIQAVFARFLAPFSQELDRSLSEYEKTLKGKRAELTILLTIAADTAFRSSSDRPQRLNIFMRLLGLAYTQGQGHLRRFLRAEYGDVFDRFSLQLSQATPHLTNEERFWRFHFMLGATMFSLSGVDSLTAMATHDLGKRSDVTDVIGQLIPFLASGMQAPSSVASSVTSNDKTASVSDDLSQKSSNLTSDAASEKSVNGSVKASNRARLPI